LLSVILYLRNCLIRDYFPVRKLNYPPALFCHCSVVRYYNYGFSDRIERLHNLHYFVCRCFVKCRCRFVRNDYIRTVYKCTGKCDTLFLSARQLVTVLVCLLFYSDQFKRSLCCFSFIFGLVFCKIKREHYPLLPVR
jgi:hypothetical protein